MKSAAPGTPQSLIQNTTSSTLTPEEIVAADFRPWLQAGVVSALDVELASLLRRLAPGDDPLVAVTAALVSRATQAGHVCLDLTKPGTWQLLDASGAEVTAELPDLTTWRACLEASTLIGDGSSPTPLVLVGQRVYLHRYFNYERRLRRSLELRLQNNEVALAERTARHLFELFPESAPGDLQRRAALIACTHRFSVISGGPGTGKTTTVAKVLSLLAEQFASRNEHMRLMLLAPTGKAATRLAESLGASLASLDFPEEKRRLLAVTPATIHRALGYQPRTPTRFRHDASNPLPVNVVVVDEAAMVDLALMTKLCEAVALTAHLILLGDRDQLASVEAGAVFGDLFNADETPAHSPQLGRQIERVLGESVNVSPTASSPIADCTIHLDKSYRYSEHGGIARFARAIRAGDVEAAFGTLTSPDLRFVELAADSNLDDASEAALKRTIAEGFAALRTAQTPEQRLSSLGQFRILSPHRRGALGVEGLNQLAQQVCLPAQLRYRDGVYPGQPILVHENDYQAELYNGDVGVIDQGRHGKLVAFFPDGEGLRQLSLARLPAHSTVYAMTIHKSQGSEFDEVVVVLPHHSSPLLSRELLYTAITRAKRRVTMVASAASLRAAIERRIERSSGLRDALWGSASRRD
jgi:exodeoxyribonuclease V alpha subunit